MNLFNVVWLSIVSACIEEENREDSLNHRCNNAGTCRSGGIFGDTCECCSPYDSTTCGGNWVCDPNNPTEQCLTFEGSTCSTVTNKYYSNIGFRAVDYDDSIQSDIECSTDPELRSNYKIFGNLSESLKDQANYIARSHGWNGTVKEVPECDSCSPEYPCTLGVAIGVIADQGFTFSFQVDFNEFYDSECATSTIYRDWRGVPDCDANYDYGVMAESVWQSVLYDDEFLLSMNDILSAEPSSDNEGFGKGFENTHVIGLRSSVVANGDLELTLSWAPTEAPTPHPTELCMAYTHNIEDLKFLGVGSNCRAGLDISYPGGLSCDSPYIICLPQENTPAEYLTSTHRYTVDECLQECANDQRCLGAEFVADQNSSLGDCNLIDDIPVEITSEVSGFTYDAVSAYTNLDSTVTNGNAVCFEKKDQCNPYFEADDLNEVMLNCYCPNNRKGFYTKQVQRTVSSTRFCGSDTDVDERIKKAQANRMFHLCENWCLFQTEIPEEEYWLWDPWRTCWREQSANSYCAHVIEDPDTIEMYFVTTRSEHFC